MIDNRQGQLHFLDNPARIPLLLETYRPAREHVSSTRLKTPSNANPLCFFATIISNLPSFLERAHFFKNVMHSSRSEIEKSGRSLSKGRLGLFSMWGIMTGKKILLLKIWKTTTCSIKERVCNNKVGSCTRGCMRNFPYESSNPNYGLIFFTIMRLNFV